MRRDTQTASHNELTELLDLTARLGADPLLTQASTGNSSIKLGDRLWIKASGRWMADAIHDDILIPLDLDEVKRCVERDEDPTERFAGASIETAMHAVLPHPVVVHVHCVNTIAWAVRDDAPMQLKDRLQGLRWQWVPYVPSGLPLAGGVENALREAPDAAVLVLGNHGLVVGGADCGSVEKLLCDVRRRLAIPARQAHPADYAALSEIVQGCSWELPDDDAVHALGTDDISRRVLAHGLLYPCQAIFSIGQAIFSIGNCPTAGSSVPFRAIPYSDFDAPWERAYADRCFLIVEGRGVVLNQSTTPAERAMISGLAQVVQRISATAPLHYLTEAEVADISSLAAYHYRELANAGKA